MCKNYKCLYYKDCECPLNESYSKCIYFINLEETVFDRYFNIRINQYNNRCKKIWLLKKVKEDDFIVKYFLNEKMTKMR